MPPCSPSLSYRQYFPRNSVEKTEDVKMETEEVKEEKITIEEIRRLKEILRQEDAKLQLIKK